MFFSITCGWGAHTVGLSVDQLLSPLPSVGRLVFLLGLGTDTEASGLEGPRSRILFVPRIGHSGYRCQSLDFFVPLTKIWGYKGNAAAFTPTSSQAPLSALGIS